MTALETLAKGAFDKMMEAQLPWAVGIPVPIWEKESQALRDCWIASTRAVIERMRDLGAAVWLDMIDDILEGKS